MGDCKTKVSSGLDSFTSDRLTAVLFDKFRREKEPKCIARSINGMPVCEPETEADFLCENQEYYSSPPVAFRFGIVKTSVLKGRTYHEPDKFS